MIIKRAKQNATVNVRSSRTFGISLPEFCVKGYFSVYGYWYAWNQILWGMVLFLDRNKKLKILWTAKMFRFNCSCLYQKACQVILNKFFRLNSSDAVNQACSVPLFVKNHGTCNASVHGRIRISMITIHCGSSRLILVEKNYTIKRKFKLWSNHFHVNCVLVCSPATNKQLLEKCH